MPALSIQPTFPIFTDIDGQPLEDGYVFIGTANLNPITNPITVYWDAALTLAAVQPIRTLGGYPMNSGTPARLYVNSDYSIQVQNKNGSVVYSAPAATERYGNIISSADISFIQSGTGAVTRTAQAKMRDSVSVKDFGAVGDGVADDTAAIQLALNTLGVTANSVSFPKGNYKLTDSLVVTSKSDFAVIGPGRLTQTVANKPSIKFISCTEFSVSNLYFYGLGTDYVPASDTSLGIGVWCESSSSFTITGNTFKNFGYSAVYSNGGCSNFEVSENKIYGTNGITSPISAGEFYQFGVILKSGTGLASANTDFSVNNNNVQMVAVGFRTEPNSQRFSFAGNVLTNIMGVHGFYLNGTKFSITGNTLTSIAGVGIKLQCFQNTPLAANEAISSASVTGNTIISCETGVSLEKTSSAANDAEYVSIVGNTINGAGNAGYGIFVTDSIGTNVADNVVNGGAYGVAAIVTTSAKGVSGRIANNRISNTRWSGIIGYAYEHLAIHGNTVVRPCLAAVASEPQQSAFYVYSSSTSNRAEVSNNTLVTGTSTGVVNGLSLADIDVWVGDNDLESKPISASGTTIRKRTMFGDYTGLALWSSIGTVSNGATLTKTVTVTGAVAADQVVSLSLASDLQGCTLNGYMTANTLNVVLTNNTGGSKTISDAFLRYSVMRFVA